MNPHSRSGVALVSIVIPACYDIFFTGRYGATPGKMICNIKVVRSNGAKVSYGTATGRYFAKWISSAILLFSLIAYGLMLLALLMLPETKGRVVAEITPEDMVLPSLKPSPAAQ